MTARLEVGDPAPDFTLHDDTGQSVTLSDFRGRKVVVYFYPKAMTPGCTTQACDFTAERATFDDAGYDIVAISPDPPEKLARFRQRDDLGITLLSDPKRDVMEAYGAFGEKMMYGKAVQGVIRSTFVVDEAGRIEEAQYNVRAKGHVAKLERDLGLA